MTEPIIEYLNHRYFLSLLIATFSFVGVGVFGVMTGLVLRNSTRSWIRRFLLAPPLLALGALCMLSFVMAFAGGDRSVDDRDREYREDRHEQLGDYQRKLERAGCDQRAITVYLGTALSYRSTNHDGPNGPEGAYGEVRELYCPK